MVYPHTYRTEHSETQTSNAVYGGYYEKMESKKIRIQPELLPIIQYIDSNRVKFFEDLAPALKIKSISGKLKYKDQVLKMITFTENWLSKLDVKYEAFNIGYQIIDGKKVRLPPVILASIGHDPKKKTVCVYLHLDVVDPANHKWTVDPWNLTATDVRYYGNGAACGKGPLMIWLHVIQAFKCTKTPFPVNLKFVIESMNHQNSEGFASFVATRSQDFFANVELVVKTGSEWLGEKYPAVIYGTVGILDFQLTVEQTKDSKTDIKDDIEKLCNTLTDDQGNITVNHFNDFVEQITPDEEKLYEEIKGFDIEEVRDQLAEYKKSWEKVKLLMSFWRLPSIYIDKTEECICDKKDTSIVKKNFIIKIVPKQVVSIAEKTIKAHFASVTKKMNIENKVTCKLISSIRPWHENHNSPSYLAARKATLQIYKTVPDLIREDRGREAVTIFDNVLEKKVLFIPLCSKGSNSEEADENISVRCYYEGTKLLAAFLFQYSYIT